MIIFIILIIIDSIIKTLKHVVKSNYIRKVLEILGFGKLINQLTRFTAIIQCINSEYVLLTKVKIKTSIFRNHLWLRKEPFTDFEKGDRVAFKGLVYIYYTRFIKYKEINIVKKYSIEKIEDVKKLE